MICTNIAIAKLAVRHRFLEFNTISPAGTVIQGYQNYQALWEPTMQESTHAYTTLDDDVQIRTDGKLGLTTFTFETEFSDRQSGERFADRGHASMDKKLFTNTFLIQCEPAN